MNRSIIKFSRTGNLFAEFHPTIKKTKNTRMKSISLIVITAVLFTACAGGGSGKKVLVMATGKFDIDKNTNTITLKPGTNHLENSFVPTTDVISVVSPSGTQEFEVKEDGYYLLNLKKDTVCGAYQTIGKEGDAPPPITQENLKFRIDSLYQLMIAYNVADSNKQYNIPPNTIKKFTNNTEAEVFGPYRPLPPSFNPALDHEIYKFYTNKEIWDLILKLHRMTR